MKTVQWLAFGLVLMIIIEIVVVPEMASGWGRRRRRWSSRRRRWTSRRRRYSSRRRRSWFRRAVSAVGRVVKKVGRVIHKAVVSKVGGYIISGISFVNGFVGGACCVAVAAPPAAVCCVVTRGIAGAACGLNTYRAQHFARNGKTKDAAFAVAGAGSACIQAATGIPPFGHLKKAAKAAWAARAASKAGRKRRSLTSSPTKLEAGSAFFAADVARLKIYVCTIMELRSYCKAYIGGAKSAMSKVLAAAKATLARIAYTHRSKTLYKLLENTKCSKVNLLPVCHASRAELKAESKLLGVNHGFSPLILPCRYVKAHDSKPTRSKCVARETYAFGHLVEVLNLVTVDIVKMYPQEFNPKIAKELVRQGEEQLVKPVASVAPPSR